MKTCRQEGRQGGRQEGKEGFLYITNGKRVCLITEGKNSKYTEKRRTHT